MIEIKCFQIKKLIIYLPSVIEVVFTDFCLLEAFGKSNLKLIFKVIIIGIKKTKQLNDLITIN